MVKNGSSEPLPDNLKALARQRVDEVKNRSNGDYAVSICLGCGEFVVSPCCELKYCTFTDVCVGCFSCKTYGPLED